MLETQQSKKAIMLRFFKPPWHPSSNSPSQSTEMSLQKSRKIVNKHIKRIGRQANLDLSLDSHGFCYIPFRKFLIIIQVPEDQPGIMLMYTMIFDLQTARASGRIRKRIEALQLRNLPMGKKGSLLSVEGDEVNLSLSIPTRGLKFKETLECLEDFMQTALDTHNNLHEIR